ncbi:paraquat-inducible protein A [Litorivivens lipolytica]|uniref:Paraquat-inducible protein A n=1 Tax=Litorivivens lipolytica TaxID=1524264 RepID=A0A7W4W4B1_9GAMM|nr:paraquat-inducible protein A [Litorivivens lipolytica]MBB3047211.1 paraquat-inducible protein A [Litorivivens lipolytica]
MTEYSTFARDSLLACPDCDLLLQVDSVPAGSECHCPRCDALVHGENTYRNDVHLAAAISGLLLFIPAVTAPVLKFTMVGQWGSNSLLSGVWRLWTESEQLLALLVLLCSVLAPFFHLLLSFGIALVLRFSRLPKTFPDWLKWHHWMQGWSMLEVYAMGIIVAYVKMLDDGDVFVGNGTYCLIGVLLSLILCNQFFREEFAWQRWEQRQQELQT